MSLRFIYGGAGKGKSTFCLEDIQHRQKEENEKPLVLLVPEQFSFQAEKNLIEVVGSTGIKNVQVLSFNRLAYKVFSEVGGITRKPMDTSGKAMLIHSIMQKNGEELKVFSAASRQKGFVDNVAGAITEFKKYGISVEDLNKVKENLGESPLLIDKITDLSLIYGEFNNILNQNYVDPDDDLTRLYSALDECDILDGAEFWLDEFTGFTPQQYGIIEKLYKKAKRVSVTMPLESSQHSKGMEESDAFYSIKFTEDKLLDLARLTGTSIEKTIELQGNKDYKFKDNAELSFLEKNYFAFPYTPTTEKCKNIKIFKGLNAYSEIEHVAKDILRICRDENIRFNKIAVVTRDLPSYEKLIKAIFTEYNIPIFIDKKKDITSNPLIVLITGAVEIFTKNFSYESVFRYLKTGLLDIKMENIDILENFVIAAGIKGKRKWTETKLWQEKIEYYFRDYYANKAATVELQKNLEHTQPAKTQKSEEIENSSIEDIENLTIKEIENLEAEETKESNIPATNEEKEAEKIEATIKILNDTRDIFIVPLIELNEKLKGKNTTIKTCTALFEFLETIKVFKTIEQWIENFKNEGAQEQVTEYSKIWNLVNELLDQMVEVLGKEILTLEDFVKILSLGFSKHQMGLIPPALDGVSISSVERIKSHDISALYIIGVNDGVFPKANKEEGIFTDSDRIILKENKVELANDTKTEVFNEQYLIYATITIPSKYLNISYAIADYEGKTLRPSIIIARFKALFKGLIEESNITEYADDMQEDHELREVSAKIPTFNGLIFALRKYLEEGYISPLWVKVYKWFQKEAEWKQKSNTMFQGFDYKNEVKMLEKEKVKLLYGEKNYFSVSRIEKYEECPFAYFVQYGLKAKERKTFTFSSPDLGSFMHSVLDNFSKLVDKSEIKWADLQKEWCQQNIESIVEKEAEEGLSGYILNSSPRYKYFTERLKRVLKRTILVIVEQMKNSGFEPFGYEVSFGFNEGDYPPIKVELSTGENVNLVGRIDRVDKLINEGEEFYRIIDYKSGNKDFKLSDVYYGLQIQLLTYLDAMLTNEKAFSKESSLSKENELSQEPIFPAGILYFKIDDPVIKAKNNLDEDELEKAIMKALKMKGLLLADTKIIREMDRNIQGASLVVPVSIKKDGELGSRSSVATKEQFDMLLNHVKENLISTCEEMLSGEIDIKPYKKKDFTPCAYCEYTAICQFDPTLKENNYKIIKDKKDYEIWELLCNESKLKIGGEE